MTYRRGGLGIDGRPESEPSYWWDTFRDLDLLTAELRIGDGRVHFPKWLDSFEENNTSYTVTEYVQGETLEEYLNSRGGFVSWLEAMRLLAPVAKALVKVHQLGKIHGEVSPSKIVLAPDGTVKLLDTGVYSAGDVYAFLTVDDAWPSHWTPYHYFSVFCRGKPTLDIYSLASCFYRAVAGTEPHKPNFYQDAAALPLPEERAACVPSQMGQILLETLQFSLKEYSSVTEFWQALEASARQR